MRASIGRLVLVGVGGAGLAWLAAVVLAPNDESRDAPAPPRAAPVAAANVRGGADSAPESQASAAGAQPAASVDPALRLDEPAPAAPAPAPDASPVSSPVAAVTSQDDTGEAGAAAIADLPDNGVRDAPQRYPDDPAPIEDLLAAPSIWCEFGEGNNQGLRIGDRLTTGGAAWMGGSLEFDLLDVDQGTARLRGSLGATGSRKGEVKVRVIVDGARVHFMGLLPTGVLQTITIYGDRSPNLGRDAGRHVAVMSRHEPGGLLSYSVQFFGSCE